MQKVGHAGTLDPIATGVLIILFGKATKSFNRLISFKKAYRAVMLLGMTTTSADMQGNLIQQKPYAHITAENITAAFSRFIGRIKQMPPMVSAVKVAGRRLYDFARKGVEVRRNARQICIDCLTVEQVDLPQGSFYLECSKGTYVRQLVDDIGVSLGCGACVQSIERLKVGPFTIDDAESIEEIDESHIRDLRNI